MFSFGKKKEEKEEDKPDGEGEGEAEADGEEADESDGEEDTKEDTLIQDEDDYTLYPLEAQDWARQVLGDRVYAKYYDIAKQRSEEDAREMLSKRTWKVSFKNIKFTNLDKEHDVFLKFCFGFDLKITRRLVRLKGEVLKQARKLFRFFPLL